MISVRSLLLVVSGHDRNVREIRDAVNRVLPDLPAGIDPPTVSKLDPDASPILYIALRAPGKPVRDVTEFADKKIRRDFETVLGVGQVKLRTILRAAKDVDEVVGDHGETR